MCKSIVVLNYLGPPLFKCVVLQMQSHVMHGYPQTSRFWPTIKSCNVPFHRTRLLVAIIMAKLANSVQDATRLSHLANGTNNEVSHYSSFYEKETEADIREEKAQELALSYYNLVSDFYEYGYGEVFSFWPVYDEHTFKEGADEFCKQIATDLHVKPGAKILVSGKLNTFYIVYDLYIHRMQGAE